MCWTQLCFAVLHSAVSKCHMYCSFYWYQLIVVFKICHCHRLNINCMFVDAASLCSNSCYSCYHHFLTMLLPILCHLHSKLVLLLPILHVTFFCRNKKSLRCCCCHLHWCHIHCYHLHCAASTVVTSTVAASTLAASTLLPPLSPSPL